MKEEAQNPQIIRNRLRRSMHAKTQKAGIIRNRWGPTTCCKSMKDKAQKLQTIRNTRELGANRPQQNLVQKPKLSKIQCGQELSPTNQCKKSKSSNHQYQTQALHPKTRINACNRPLHKIPTPQSASQNISKIADQFQYPPCVPRESQKHTYQSLSVVQLPGGSSVHSSLFVCASKSSI